MADITMCTSTKCPLKASCYRSTAEAHPRRQSYSNFYIAQQDVDKKGECEYYWVVDTKDVKVE